MTQYTFVLFIYALVATSAHSQNASISVNVPNAKDSTEVWFSSPIDEDPQNYCYKSVNTTIQGGVFTGEFNIEGTSLITIERNEYFSRAQLILDPGDKVKIEVSQSGNKITYQVSGNNKEGHLVLLHAPLFKGFLLNALVDSVFKKSNSSRDAIVRLEKLRSDLFSDLDALDSAGKVTKSFFKLISAQAEARFLFAISAVATGYLMQKSTNIISLNTDELNEIQKVFFSRYDPFLEKYKNIEGIILGLNIRSKCELIQKNILQGQNHDIGLWIRPTDQYLSYAPVDNQYRLMANNLLVNRDYNVNEFKADSSDFVLLKERWKENTFVTFIDDKYFSQGNKFRNIKPYTFATRDKGSFQIEEIKQFKTLPELIEFHFKGKPVFVDVWATWCSPCLEEFKHADSLAHFLKKNHIELLYVTIDNPQAAQNWIKTIEKYTLEGNHYFGTREITGSLSILVKDSLLAIPRYIVFDKRGNMITSNAPRPSEKERLYSLLTSKLVLGN